MYAQWPHGPSTEADYFPIAVWLQDPANAPRYREAGIDLYVGLWQGPTEEQLAALRAAGMPVICDQNAVGLAHLDDPIIVGWMHGDEPDNAQWNSRTQTYDPPIAPEVVIEEYERMRQRDPSRPVLLNLGQGVAWDGYPGRGVRTGHPEDYARYVQGTDIASFDMYPVASTRRETHGKLWLVPYGVQRLVQWTRPDQPVWNCIECTRIYSTQNKATPHQVEAEVWMSLIHGSRGLIWFVHEWHPVFDEHALLDDPEMLAAVTAINHQIHDLAPVLNSPPLEAGVTVTSSRTDVPVAATARQWSGSGYVFAVAMRNGATRATFTLDTAIRGATVEVLGENRTLAVEDGAFADDFQAWDVHLYRIH